jgi:DNA mismatch endonuclease (patch repair protein)
VFPRARVAVFVDGCFWHGCEEHGRMHHIENAWYWPEKIASNKRRDRDTDEKLAAEGWLAIRIWEHEDTLAAATRVAAEINEARRLGFAELSLIHPQTTRHSSTSTPATRPLPCRS